MAYSYGEILRGWITWAQKIVRYVSSAEVGVEESEEARLTDPMTILDLPAEVFQRIISHVHCGGKTEYWRRHGCHGKVHSRPSFERDWESKKLLLVSKTFSERVLHYEKMFVMQRMTAIKSMVEVGFSMVHDRQHTPDLESALLDFCLTIEKVSDMASNGFSPGHSLSIQRQEDARARIFGIGFIMISNLQLQRLSQPNIIDGFVASLTPLGLLVLRATTLMFSQHCRNNPTPILVIPGLGWPRQGRNYEPSVYENALLSYNWLSRGKELMPFLGGKIGCHDCIPDPMIECSGKVIDDIMADPRQDLKLTQGLQRAYPGTSFAAHLNLEKEAEHRPYYVTNTQYCRATSDTAILLIKIDRMIEGKSIQEVFTLLQQGGAKTH